MRRSIWIAGGVVLVVLLLVGAAFVGGRLLNRQEQTSGGSGPRMMVRTGDGGTTSSFEIEPSDELPPSVPDAAGLFLRREDNSIFVGTGQIMMVVENGEMDAEHDGPEVEVVVTHDTTVYCDETTLQFREASEDGKIQQVLGPGSLEEIGANNAISVWGERRGDRLFAEVLVYTAPMVLD